MIVDALPRTGSMSAYSRASDLTGAALIPSGGGRDSGCGKTANMKGSILDVSDYWRILRRSWILILVFSLAGMICAAGLTLATKPKYTAETRLFVAIQSSGTVSELQQGNTFSQARVKSYVEIVRTPAVLQPAIDTLGLDITPAKFAAQIVASTDLNTVIVTISATNTSPVQAAAMAQAVGDSLIRTVDALESSETGGTSPVKISVVTPAVAPSSPSSPNPKLNVLIGLLVGTALGVSAAVMRSTLDTRIRGESDVHAITDTPIMGGISFETEAVKSPLISQLSHQNPRAEAFRQIRTNLQFANVAQKSKTMLVTSSIPGEGKSTTATNMAIAMAQAGRSVVLVDADLRRPMLAEYLGLERDAGLTTALIGNADLGDVLQPWGRDDLWVLTSGQIPPNPSELLGSPSMSELLGELETKFDVVIIDAPPLLPVTDAAVLAQRVGGVIVVVGASKAKSTDVKKALNALELVGAEVIGLVLNLLPSKGPDAYAHSYYSYEPNVREVGAIDGGRSGIPRSSPGSHFSDPTAGSEKRLSRGRRAS